MSNELLPRVLGSKFGTWYRKFLKESKKDRKKHFKRSTIGTLLDIIQTEDSYIDVDTIIMPVCGEMQSSIVISL